LATQLKNAILRQALRDNLASEMDEVKMAHGYGCTNSIQALLANPEHVGSIRMVLKTHK